MREPDRVTGMAAEQTNVDVAASSEELRKAETLGISDRIDREREGDSRDDADTSRIQSSGSRRRVLLRQNKAQSRRSPPGSAISNETLDSLIALGNELKKIRRRLFTEGYVIDAERIYKPNEYDIKQ